MIVRARPRVMTGDNEGSWEKGKGESSRGTRGLMGDRGVNRRQR